MDSTIIDAIAGEIPPRLIVEMPPRHGKSTLASKWLPPWFVGTFPDKRVIFASYEADFASTFGRQGRNILEEFGAPIFGARVADDSSARNRWDIGEDWDDQNSLWATNPGGGMMTAGVGGALTGKGADLLIVDDPIKNDQEASSPTHQKRIWDWWQSTAFTRLEPGGIAIVIQTRWHENDLAGRLKQQMKQGGQEWHTLSLPALAEDNDALGRKPGEALWPERYDEKAFEDIQAGTSSYFFNALYQQRPTPAKGGIFKADTWQFYPPLKYPEPTVSKATASWDFAFKRKEDSDFVVGQLWSQLDADRYLVAQIRGRMSFTESKKAIKALAGWARLRGFSSHRKLVEDKANGSAIIDDLRHTVSGMVPVDPEGGKVARAHAVEHYVEGGNVYIPDGLIPCPPSPHRSDGTPLWEATTTEEFVDEHKAFPFGINDDQVDALTQYLVRSGGTSLAGLINEPRKETDPLASELLDERAW